MEKLVKQIKDLLPTGFFPQKGDQLPWAKDWAIKLLSLFFALFLWYFVVGEDKVDMTVHIPVEIVNLPRDLVISNQFKKQLEVTVAGPRGLIRGIANQHVSRAVDLSKATPGSMLVRNDEDAITFPRGIRVLRVQPPYITLLLDQLIKQDMPIKAITKGQPATGYQVESIVFDPRILSLTGPQATLGSQTELTTSPIDISDLDSSVVREVSLDLPPEISDLIGETTVTANITIIEKTILRKITNNQLTIIDLLPTNSAVIQPTKIMIRAEIPLSINKNIKKLQTLFTVTASAANLPPGKHTVAVRVDKKNPQIQITEISPAKVTLIIEPVTRKK
ncbi:MAG: CdaR family protein [Desulfobulbaceae bacterium]|nr:CdaR family protein [Desulfobulbaceae bacterium]